MHRDLKLENVMMDWTNVKEGKGELICKITDFGFATMIEKRKKTLSVGSPVYMAPEVLNK